MSNPNPLTTTTLAPPPQAGAAGGGATRGYNTGNAATAAPGMNIAGMLASAAPPIFESLLGALGVSPATPPHPLPSAPGAAYSALFAVTIIAHMFAQAYDRANSAILMVTSAVRLVPRRYTEAQGGCSNAYATYDFVRQSPGSSASDIDAARDALRATASSCQQALIDGMFPGPGLTPWHHSDPPSQTDQWGLATEDTPFTLPDGTPTLASGDLNAPRYDAQGNPMDQAVEAFSSYIWEMAVYCNRMAVMWNRVFVAFFVALVNSLLHSLQTAEQTAQTGAAAAAAAGTPGADQPQDGGPVAQAAAHVPIPPIPVPTAENVTQAWGYVEDALSANRQLDIPHFGGGGGQTFGFPGGLAPAMSMSNRRMNGLYPGLGSGGSRATDLRPNTGRLRDPSNNALSRPDMQDIADASPGGTLDFSAVLFGTAFNEVQPGHVPGTSLAALEDPPFVTAVTDFLSIVSWANSMAIDVRRRGSRSGNQALAAVARSVSYPFIFKINRLGSDFQSGDAVGDCLEQFIENSTVAVMTALAGLFPGHGVLPAPNPPPGAPAALPNAHLPNSPFVAFILALLISRVSGGAGGWHQYYRKEL